jgi:hypothetical protein
MQQQTRTDVHRPSEFNPADYRWVGYTDDGDSAVPPLSDGPMFRRLDEGEAPVPTDRVNEIHPGGCDMCGHRPLRHRYFYLHEATGEVIVLGIDCAEKATFETRQAMLAAKRVRAEREAEATRRIVEEYTAANPKVVAFLEGVYEGEINVGRTADFLLDLRAKMIRYGYLTEKQTAAVEKIIARQAEFEAKRAEEDAAASPIPAEVLNDRAVIKGEVLSVKWRDSQFGGSYKMVVRDERGFKVWGTCPDAILDPGVKLRYPDGGEAIVSTADAAYRAEDVQLVEAYEAVGSIVTFACRVERSDDDEAFGFFKRPTKSSVLTPKVAAE